MPVVDPVAEFVSIRRGYEGPQILLHWLLEPGNWTTLNLVRRENTYPTTPTDGAVVVFKAPVSFYGGTPDWGDYADPTLVGGHGYMMVNTVPHVGIFRWRKEIVVSGPTPISVSFPAGVPSGSASVVYRVYLDDSPTPILTTTYSQASAVGLWHVIGTVTPPTPTTSVTVEVDCSVSAAGLVFVDAMQVGGEITDDSDRIPSYEDDTGRLVCYYSDRGQALVLKDGVTYYYGLFMKRYSTDCGWVAGGQAKMMALQTGYWPVKMWALVPGIFHQKDMVQ